MSQGTSGKLPFDVLAILVEFERGLGRERTKVKLAAARTRGRKLKFDDR